MFRALLRGAFFAACDNDMWEIMGVIGSFLSVSRRFYQITAQIRWDRSAFLAEVMKIGIFW